MIPSVGKKNNAVVYNNILNNWKKRKTLGVYSNFTFVYIFFFSLANKLGPLLSVGDNRGN